MRRRQSAFLSAAWLLIAGTAFAVDTPVPAPPAQNETALPSDSMLRFLADNPACREFTDGCSVCAVTEGKPVCSAPRIACTVHAFQCVIGK